MIFVANTNGVLSLATSFFKFHNNTQKKSREEIYRKRVDCFLLLFCRWFAWVVHYSVCVVTTNIVYGHLSKKFTYFGYRKKKNHSKDRWISFIPLKLKYSNLYFIDTYYFIQYLCTWSMFRTKTSTILLNFFFARWWCWLSLCFYCQS